MRGANSASHCILIPKNKTHVFEPSFLMEILFCAGGTLTVLAQNCSFPSNRQKPLWKSNWNF